MNLEKFFDYVDNQKKVDAESGLYETFHELAQEALKITNKSVMEALDGLPPVKVHCSCLAEQALQSALWDYAQKNNITIEGLKPPKEDVDHHHHHEE